nr:aminoacyl trna synthase complex-interacting multifunctional protein 1 [Quercus suber]
MLDIRVGRVVKAWRHEEADSLYVEQVDVGEAEPRTICSGLVNFVPLHLLQDKKVVVLANLKPRNMRGVKSCGMLMAASDASHENVELLVPPEDSLPGERIWFGSEEEKENQPAAATPNQSQWVPSLSLSFCTAAADTDAATVGSNTNKNEEEEEEEKKKKDPDIIIKEAAEMLDIRVGRVVKAWRHEEADSLYVEQVDVGEAEPRTICSGLVNFVPLHLLQDKKVVVLANLKPRNMRGVKSCGMLMAASDASHENVELLVPPEDSLPGERIWFGSEEEKENQPAAATPNQIQKKKIWELVQPHLKTDASCTAMLGLHVMRTSAGNSKETGSTSFPPSRTPLKPKDFIIFYVGNCGTLAYFYYLTVITCYSKYKICIMKEGELSKSQ